MKNASKMSLVALLFLAACQKASIDAQVEKKGVGPGSGGPSKATNCDAAGSAKEYLISQKDLFGEVRTDSIQMGCFGANKDCLYGITDDSRRSKLSHYSFLYLNAQNLQSTASIFINTSDKCKAVGWGVNDLREDSESVSGCDLRKAIAKYEGVKENHPRLKFMGQRLTYSIFGIKKRNLLSGDLPDSTVEVFTAFENEDGGSTLGLYFLDSKTCKVVSTQRTNLEAVKKLDFEEDPSPTPEPQPQATPEF